MGNIQESQSSVIETLITDANLREGLKKAKGSDSQMVSWEVKNFTSKGDNNVGIVTGIEIRYILNGEESSISFIAKLGPPQPTKVINDSINFAFVKEAEVYLELIPLLNAELTSLGLKVLRVPKCYYASCKSEEEVIYLQDLRSLGYNVGDRKKTLDIPQTTLVLKELGRLHASSLLLQVKDGYEDLDEKYPFLNKDCFDVTSDTVKLSTEILDKHLEKSIKVLSEFDGYEAAVQWLKKLRPHAFQELLKQLDNRSRFAVVCHGDCWSNNILFRYDSEGNPSDVMLIDLQLFRRASLAIDLKMFFYHSLTGPDRKSNLDYYLDVYYTSFKLVVAAGGLEMPFTREELTEEYKSKHLYGCMWAITCLPTLASDSEFVPDEGFASDSATHKEQSSSEVCDEDPSHPPEGKEINLTLKENEDSLNIFRKNPDMTSRFLSLFDDIIERDAAECH